MRKNNNNKEKVMSLYIRSTLCVYSQDINQANVSGESSWSAFDQLNNAFNELVSPHDLYLDREVLEDGGEWVMVLHNGKRPQSKVFYDGSAFEYDMTIADDDGFIERVQAALAVLRADERFAPFAPLLWTSEAQKLHFVSSWLSAMKKAANGCLFIQ